MVVVVICCFSAAYGGEAAVRSLVPCSRVPGQRSGGVLPPPLLAAHLPNPNNRPGVIPVETGEDTAGVACGTPPPLLAKLLRSSSDGGASMAQYVGQAVPQQQQQLWYCGPLTPGMLSLPASSCYLIPQRGESRLHHSAYINEAEIFTCSAPTQHSRCPGERPSMVPAAPRPLASRTTKVLPTLC